MRALQRRKVLRPAADDGVGAGRPAAEVVAGKEIDVAAAGKLVVAVEDKQETEAAGLNLLHLCGRKVAHGPQSVCHTVFRSFLGALLQVDPDRHDCVPAVG
jgi:hypothetical protein